MLTPGALLQNRYQIVRAIGQGGVGTVYQAIDERLGHTVAIKQIHQRDPLLQAAFEGEARLLAALHHPALPKVTDHFVEEAGHFLVMEFVPGDDLATQLLHQQKPLPVDDVLRWADQLLDALIYLHSQQPPVIHRDIKPQNLKRNTRGDPVLLDFGLAKGAPGRSSDHSLVGYTLHYAAPEQLRGAPTDARSDLYSLCATLYDLLSAVKPSNALQRFTAISTAQPDPLRPLHLLNPAVSVALAEVIHQGLALVPGERFADATTMRFALHATGGDSTKVVMQKEPARTAATANNLPIQLTSFVGREQEVEAVQQLVRTDGVRLVTLNGPGGIGKTRLSLAVASSALPYYPDGVYFVSLAPIRDPHLVLPAIAQTLGLREMANTTVLQSVQSHLHDKEVLLVLDNFEQVVAAAPLIGDLLSATLRLKLIVTSREVLHLRGEQEFPVPALALPDPKELPPLADVAQFDAIKLFTQRAQLVKPGFLLTEANATVIADICKRLDGLPLAIELAAASVKLLSPSAILARLSERFELLPSGLRDLPERQRTLQALFRRLSIFRGGFDLAAAEALCANLGESALLANSVLEGIMALVDKSLLKSHEASEDEPRFTMLETLHEFGLRRLAAAGELETTQSTYADYYYHFVREAEQEIWGANIAVVVRRLDVENDNLRTALNYYLRHIEGAERGLEMAGWLWRFWEIRGYYVEGRTWLERALQRRAEASTERLWIPLHGAGNLASDQGEYTLARQHYLDSLHLLQALLSSLTETKAILRIQHAIGNTLMNLGNNAINRSEFAEALSYTEEALAIHRQLASTRNSKPGIGISLTNLAKIRMYQGEFAQAEAVSQEALAIYRTPGDDRVIGWNLNTLGTIARQRGDYAQARHYYHEYRRLLEKLSSQADMADLYLNLGELAIHQEHYAEAEAHYRAGLALAQALGSKKDIANLLDRLSRVASYWGHYGQASSLNQQSIQLQQEIGNLVGLSESLYSRGKIAYAQGNVVAAHADYQESLQIKAKLGERRGILDLLHALAAVAANEESGTERAARLLGAAQSLTLAMGIRLRAVEGADEEALIDTLRTRLAAQQFTAAWAAGEAMSVDDAVAYASEKNHDANM